MLCCCDKSTVTVVLNGQCCNLTWRSAVTPTFMRTCADSRLLHSGVHNLLLVCIGCVRYKPVHCAVRPAFDGSCRIVYTREHPTLESAFVQLVIQKSLTVPRTLSTPLLLCRAQRYITNAGLMHFCALYSWKLSLRMPACPHVS